MLNFLTGLFRFLATCYSEPGSESGSSSRILTTILSLVASGILFMVFYHVVHISDIGQLTQWLDNIPYIIGSLVLFFTAPYGVNKGSGSIVDILNIFKGKK